MKKVNKEIEEVENDSQEEKKETSKLVKVLKELMPYIIILLIVVIVRTYFYTPIIVSGPSMNPTLDGGEIMILDKRAKIDRFDVVVVDIGTEVIIKRVIALPGENIKCDDNKIYVNYHLQEESYSQGVTCPSGSSEFEVSLADDEYFVMGDNRGNSTDSRSIGPVKKDQIKGTTKLVLYPFKKFGNIK